MTRMSPEPVALIENEALPPGSATLTEMVPPLTVPVVVAGGVR